MNSYDMPMTWIYVIWCWCMWTNMMLWSHIYKMMFVPFSSDWNRHVKLLATILCWLRKNGFTIGSFTKPSERQTGLENGLCHDVYTLETENIDAILHMNQPCNATELCIFIGYVNYYRTCCRVAHVSLNWIDPRFDNLLHGQTKCRKHLYNAFAHGWACTDHNKIVQHTHQCLWLSVRHAYHPRRKASCLLLLRLTMS